MEEEEVMKSEVLDLDFISCLLQPQSKPPFSPNSNLDYVGIRRFLLQQKGEASSSAIAHRKDWRCNGRGYVAYRNYLKKPGQWEQSSVSSQTNTPGNSGRWASSLGPIMNEDDSWGSSRDLHVNSNMSHRTSFSSSGSFAEQSVRSVQPAYSFVGMHCIFDSCKSAVTILKFGHMSSNLLAYGATDGSLTICDVAGSPKVLHSLKGHTKDITDFDFSLNNQYIASSSLDKTVRVWEIIEGSCMRVIYGISPQLCIRFHPVNNNLLLVGNVKKEINTINFSTGRIVNTVLFEKEITAIDNDHTGQIIFAGDAQGCIYSVVVNSHTGSVSKAHRNRNGVKVRSPITTVQYRTFSLSTRSPVLLACAQDGTLSFFSVALEIQGYLTLCCSLKLAPRVHTIRASFCPLLSLEKGEFIVSGSEDSNVYFYDLTRPKHTCVNKLQGHAAPVIGVAWNHGENLLASSDSVGMVIVWKRAKAS